MATLEIELAPERLGARSGAPCRLRPFAAYCDHQLTNRRRGLPLHTRNSSQLGTLVALLGRSVKVHEHTDMHMKFTKRPIA
ncbi:hypothetical protein M2324_003924 [Rhodovulum sulfidophilum]|nr:hypothetical protein [Rhodovulum sulfidophilum]